MQAKNTSSGSSSIGFNSSTKIQENNFDGDNDEVEHLYDGEEHEHEGHDEADILWWSIMCA